MTEPAIEDFDVQPENVEPDPEAADEGDDFTELSSAQIGRIDLVKQGANGFPFLIAKGQQGFMPPDLVRQLADQGRQFDPKRDDVAIVGSPAAVMKMIHEAAVRGRRPSSPNKEPAMTAPTTVEKALDIDEPLEGAGDSSPMPGSPEWEAIDAATACKWISVLGRAKNAVCLLSEREMQEAVVGDTGDAGSALDLQDAEAAIDCAISILAPYAVGEQMEAGEESDDLTLVGKAMADAILPLDVIEGFAPVVKAGRVLSGSNEKALRDAVALLQNVLATLPAPAPDGGQSVAKEADMATTPKEIKVEVKPVLDEAALASAAQAALAKSATLSTSNDPTAQLTLGIVHKAKGDPVVVVFNAEGKLIGVVDPEDLLPVSDSKATDGDGDGDGAAPADGAAPTDGAADGTVAAAAAPDGDGAAVIPGTDTVAAPAAAAAAPADDDVTKSAADPAAAFTDALGEALSKLAAQYESKNSELATLVKGLQERVEHLAAKPDDRKSPLLSGALSDGNGNEGAAGNEVELQKAVDDAKTDTERGIALQRLAFAKIRARFEQH